jgi:hypothetical protein
MADVSKEEKPLEKVKKAIKPKSKKEESDPTASKRKRKPSRKALEEDRGGSLCLIY